MLHTLIDDWLSQWPILLMILLYLGVSLSNYLILPKNLPPSLPYIPLIGSFALMSKVPHLNLVNIKKKYGEACTLHAGLSYIISLNSYDIIREAFVKQGEIFSQRALKYFPKSLHNGVMVPHGKDHDDFRRFSLSMLKGFGVGTTSFESQIKDEIDYFLNELSMSKGKPMDISTVLRKSATNIICLNLLGKRYDYDDPILTQLVDVNRELIDAFGFGTAEQLLPDMFRSRKLLSFFGASCMQNSNIKILSILKRMVWSDSGKLHTSCEESDFIKAWKEAEGDPKKSNFTDINLLCVMRDLFIAGSDTTANTILWGLMHLMQHPNVQEKIHQELCEVVGNERSPSLSDEKNLPYLGATILEIGRVASLLPFFTRATSKDTTLKGYFIPNGTMVIANMWAVHHDEDLFPEPYEFKPERFLTADNKLKRVNEVLPYSIGKRNCLGESVAKNELFLYLASMFQQFTFKKVHGATIDFDHFYAFVISPNPYKLHVIARESELTP